MKFNNTYQRGRRLWLALLCLIAASTISAYADAWDGTTYSTTLTYLDPGSPGTAGTAENPYLITCAEDLAYLAKTESLWSMCFLQTADIDLGSHSLEQRIGNTNFYHAGIGYGIANSSGSITTTNISHAFSGTYDGGGFSIARMYVPVRNVLHNTSVANSAFGLFGFACNATLRNIVIDGALIDFPENLTVKNTYADLRVGILAGAVSAKGADKEMIIENIQVINSKIINTTSVVSVPTIFAGGLIGDLASGYGGTAVMFDSEYDNVKIANVYVNTDILLNNVVHEDVNNTGKLQQFNVGGIIGRIRKGNFNQLPTNTFYTGQIYAPTSTISPTWGAARANTSTNSALSLLQSYSGEYQTATDAFSYIGKTTKHVADGKSADMRQNRYYGAYSIWDATAATPGYVTIDDNFGDEAKGRYGERTLADNTNTSTGLSNSKTYNFADVTNPAFMAHYQGVNHALYADFSNDAKRTEVLDMLNAYADAHSLVRWSDNTTLLMMGVRPRLNISRLDATTFEIEVFNAPANDNGYSYTITAVDHFGNPATTIADVTGKSKIYTIQIDNAEQYSALTVRATHALPTAMDIEGALTVDAPSVNISQTAFDTLEATITSNYNTYYPFWRTVDYGGHFTDLAVHTPTLQINTEEVDKIYCSWGKLNSDGTYTLLAPFTKMLDVSRMSQFYRLEVKTLPAPGGGLRYAAYLYDTDGTTLLLGGDPLSSEYISTLPAGMEDYSWKWEIGLDAVSAYAWELVDGSLGTSYLDPNMADVESFRYYRVSFGPKVIRMGDFVDVSPRTQGIAGKRQVIFVYDKTKTEQGRTLRTLKKDYITGAQRPFTTFDGMNRWTDIYGNEQSEEYPDGDDRNTGYDPKHAVKTIKRAYELIDAYDYQGNPRTVDDNIIVIMGFYYDETYEFLSTAMLEHFSKPATITGERGTRIYDGALGFTNGNTANSGLQSGASGYILTLGASTKFEDLTWIGYQMPYSTSTLARSELHLYCNRNDLTIGDNVKMIGYRNITEKWGTIDKKAVPAITLVGGTHNFSGGTIPTPKFNVDNDWTQIDISSGCIGRVIAGARNNTKAKVYGTPETPHRVKVKVGIFHPAGDRREYAPCEDFPFDIGLITAGQTDGSIFSEAEITINGGHIGRYISGNISYGRSLEDIPDDTFSGSSTLNFIGGTIEELYGGSLGRHASGESEASKRCDAYFYGRSIINIDGGNVSSVVYGAGSGGVAGIGTCNEHSWHHTNDEFIPYRTTTNDNPVGAVSYGNYNTIASMAQANGRTVSDYIPRFVLAAKDEEGHHITLGLDTVHCEVNIYSGIIDGNIFGGSLGYSSQTKFDLANVLAGNIYGNCYVNIGRPGNSNNAVIINGNIYGGGCGASNYYEDKYRSDNGLNATAPVPYPGVVKDRHYDNEFYLNALEKFGMVSQVFGDTHVTINSGTINGNVFAGSKGIPHFQFIGGVHGNTYLTVNGGVIQGNIAENTAGTIYGGCDVAQIYHRDDDPNCLVSGNTYLTMNDGIIGNCVFGGSKGIDGVLTWIQGSTHVTINNGSYVDTPYFIRGDATSPRRTFNIYGGGQTNCTIEGDTHLNIYRSLLTEIGSVIDNPTGDIVADNATFTDIFHDLLVRRFCVYGGGYGKATEVLGNTHVNINLQEDAHTHFVIPNGEPIDAFHPGQMFFDICGGGYSGNVGYWTRYKRDNGGNVIIDTETGLPEHDIRVNDIPAAERKVSDYDEFVNGTTTIMVLGTPIIRKLVGGGFYASVRNTAIHLISGKIGTVVGGALLGYVHKNAELFVGTIPYDYLTLMAPEGTQEVNGETVPDWTDEQRTEAERLSRLSNNRLYVVNDIYGGNDVKGIVGTTFWKPDYYEDLYEGFSEQEDGAPLFAAAIDEDETKGVNLFIAGGTIMGNVYGAGNGNYRGYYVPGWLRYEDGDERHYRKVLLPQALNPDGTINESIPEEDRYGRVYRSRPMTGSVCMHIGGSENSPVDIMGNVFGGGRSCTIGQYNTVLPFEDPRRLVRGGFLHLNIGSNVNIHGNLYGGNEGSLFANQHTIPVVDGTPVVTDLRNFITKTVTPTSVLNKLGDIAYDHWYLDRDKLYYVPGFPRPEHSDLNNGVWGEHMFRGYLKNVEMNGDVEFTFYEDPYERNADGSIKIATNAQGQTYRVRKRWVPAERAAEVYRANNTTIRNIFLGGAAGSMSNNNEMLYDYTDNQAVLRSTVKTQNADGTWTVKPEYAAHDIEDFGAIYRLTVPSGINVLDKIVGGSEDGTNVYYGYNDDYTEVVTTTKVDDGSGNMVSTDARIYTFEGGIVTQSLLTYPLIVYTDYHNLEPNIDIPASVYATWFDNEAPASFSTSYVMQHGDIAGQTIFPLLYPEDNNIENGMLLHKMRYALAVKEDDGRLHAFTGYRSERRGTTTAVKMGIGASFYPQLDPELISEDELQEIEDAEAESGVTHYEKRFGGVIYGGCFNSGITNGDIIINVLSDMIGQEITHNSATNFGELSSLKYNIGRIFGGGYGPTSVVNGDTYINLLAGVKAMNVFGGGCRGDVNGQTTINYVGDETESTIFGAIYGGGLYGSVGYRDGKSVATDIMLISGNVDKVYGGSCMGDIYGSSYIRLMDKIFTNADIDHFDYDKMTERYGDWRGSRLIVGSVFGGNDISGQYHTVSDLNLTPAEQAEYEATGEYPDRCNYYNTTIKIYEEAAAAFPGSGKDTPGAVETDEHKWYSGFPLVGNMYSGSNGAYGNDGDSERQHYTGGEITLAIGDNASTMTFNLANPSEKVPGFTVPHIDRARLKIRGGSVINAFGGGNKATVNETTDIIVNYNPDNLMARAGFWDISEVERVWNVLHLSSSEERTEFLHPQTVNDVGGNEREGYILDFQVFRLFGGNNHASMNIQPEWHLTRGFIGSLYSGGNFGKMTHFGYDDAHTPMGISMTINSPDLHADYVYGGGRVGDVNPQLPESLNDSERESILTDPDFYGTTLRIKRGVIDHVHGGNDVSGTIHQGSKVQIEGAIAGDVYCAGNGNYRYVYDRSETPVTEIAELYDNAKGGRYFLLPPLAEYGGTDATPAQRLLAINHYRPNAERVLLEIGGSPTAPAYVRGSVYCGGNSATVNYNGADDTRNTIRLNVNSNVVLNGLYLGSNGAELANPDMIRITGANNEVDMRMANDLTAAELALLPDEDKQAGDTDLYPHLLDLYLRAVDVTALPKDFAFSESLTNAYIGDFFVGGNCGSMLTTKTINIPFPESLILYGKVVGGSNMSNLLFDGTQHYGGLIAPLDDSVINGEKVHLSIHSKFEPWKISYPLNGDWRQIKLVADVEKDETTGKLYFPETKCNIYGGCFSSGRTIGNIAIDLYSDVLAEEDYSASEGIGAALAEVEGWVTGEGSEQRTLSKKRVIVDGIDDVSRRSFAIVGGGYGANTSVIGDIAITLMPVAGDAHPSTAAVFAGSQLGTVIGNTITRIRDGKVLTNVYGASESQKLYGSTHTLVGWPSYYISKPDVQRVFILNRTDNLSKAALGDWRSADGAYVVRHHLAMLGDEIISKELYGCIPDADKAELFTFVEDKPSDTPGLTWDDIDIEIGDQGSLRDNDAEYFGHGNIYGGGFISSKSTASLAGEYTVCRYDEENNPDLDPSSKFIGYGGNTVILISDNPENAVITNTIGEADASDGSIIRDHISVGTGHYVAAKLVAGNDVIGKYVRSVDGSGNVRFVHQAPYVLGSAQDENGVPLGTADPMLQNTYYTFVTDGGVYGGGRKVFTQGFRDCEITAYGYTSSTPQSAKLFNTAQRLDLLSINDCCMQLNGANDFATNTVDATVYSLTRVGELNMNSTLEPQLIAQNLPLNPGVEEDDESLLRNILHETPRSRNYIAFFHDVRYLSAVTSSTAFDDTYRGADGVQSSFADEATRPTMPSPYTELASNYSYRQFKANRIDNYYALRDVLPSETVEDEARRGYLSRMFDRRNQGTSANMIGINNGFTLKVQGAVTHADNSDEVYYGPATGVFEVKLLTLAPNEGGGYVLALNKHDDPNNFLESPGNFVFPGAAYREPGAEVNQYNYVHDDCFPMGVGWDTYQETCNDEQEIHYWYVNGKKYYYNVTLTAYTYNNPMQFTLDNVGQIIYLYGVTPGATTLTVNNVNWIESPNDVADEDPDNDGDLQDLSKDYRLYVSVDDSPNHFHDVHSPDYREHAFITTIPRSNYYSTLPEGTRTTDTAADPSNEGNTVNNFKNYTSDGTNVVNSPMLGISLNDAVDNSTTQYYQTHLKEPENVRIELTTGGESPFTYVVNLTINYLQGPYIEGLPEIENCALPGEYIFANSFGVTVHLDDENMAVTGRNWYLIDGRVNLENPADVRDAVAGINATNPEDKVVGIRLDSERFDNDRQVHIPAYCYLNGWHLVYEVIANNMPFYLSPTTEFEGDLVDTGDLPGDIELLPFQNQMLIHNYHRMRPYDGISVLLDDEHLPITYNGGQTVPRLEDLHITAGARLYIEDDADMEYFYLWLKDCQTASTRHTEAGQNINPQYGDSLLVFLMNDVKMPTFPITYYDPDAPEQIGQLTAADRDNLRFQGTFHGNGCSIDMMENEHFLGSNTGRFYNTGFLMGHAGSAVFVDNEEGTHSGLVEDCFLFNKYLADVDKGKFVEQQNGTVVNSARSTVDTDEGQDGNGTFRAPLSEFEFGGIAYSLNRFYLKKRYNLATGTPDGDLLAPLKEIYHDGEYRYAHWSTTPTATALRTYEVPNYHDYRSKRINVDISDYTTETSGRNATHHCVLNLVDEPRAQRTYETYTEMVLNEETGEEEEVEKQRVTSITYEPNYPEDFIFFGQDLDYMAATLYPTAKNDENRVYRASGFRNSKIDRGFYFNVDAQVVDDGLTAVDLTGIRDAEHGNVYKMEFDAGYADQHVFYPPALDLPTSGIASLSTSTKLNDESIDEAPEGFAPVTRNLLVYVPNEAPSTYASELVYDDETAEDAIYAHLISEPVNSYNVATLSTTPQTDLLHLVDREDFNCPIEFTVNEKTWYQRRPEFYSSGNNAWEGVFLPFTVKKVVAELDGEGNPTRNMGEVSHFYGDGHNIVPEGSSDPLEEATSHEYWLRKFTGTEVRNVEGADETYLMFSRPGGTDDVAANYPANKDELNPDYFFSNTYFNNAYPDYWDNNDTDKRDQYNGTGVHYRDYPMITADMPYIISFPGPKFREFDFSGEFYHSLNTYTTQFAQRINYITEGENTITVTDDNVANHLFDHDGYGLRGTYVHHTTSASEAVVNRDDNHASFTHTASNPDNVVDPFRVYVCATGYSPAPLRIGEGNKDVTPVPVEEEDEDMDLDESHGIEIFLQNNDLHVVSHLLEDLTLPLYDVVGRIHRYLDIHSGENIFSGLSSGFYVLKNNKIYIK